MNIKAQKGHQRRLDRLPSTKLLLPRYYISLGRGSTRSAAKLDNRLAVALTVPWPSSLPYLISFQGLRFFLQGLSYQDLTEQCFQLLVHQLNAGFKLLEHGFADMQFFTVIEAPGPEQ